MHSHDERQININECWFNVSHGEFTMAHYIAKYTKLLGDITTLRETAATWHIFDVGQSCCHIFMYAVIER